MPPMLRAAWDYRSFILGSVKREFQSRYRSSMLGISWTFIQPLALIIVYTVVFSQIISVKLPGVESGFGYSIYLCAGILTWGLFAEITQRGTAVFLEQANLLKKISFPRLCLPVIVVSTALLNFSIILGLFLIFLLLVGQFPGWVILAMIPVLLIQLALAAGLGVTLGVLNVFFRDVGQLYAVILQFWFWLTPIVYPVAILPDAAQQLMQLNPMAPLIGAYQTIFVQGSWPDWVSLLPVTLLAILLCVLGMHLYRKHGHDMVDEL
ncbi:ABC transporter permease [Ectothiorhodospira haloalkaliphila]